MIKAHLIAFLTGFIMDQIIGDPMNIPHPIRAIGNLINYFDVTKKEEKQDPEQLKLKGAFMCVAVLAIVIFATRTVLFYSYRANKYIGMAAEAILTCYILAARSLKDESMKVYDALEKEGLEAGRKAVSMIVGRDTQCLDEAGVVKATVETIAENTSDGVIAPMIYTFIGGPVLGFAYKAINTMDSMVGYRNERYENFGKFAAKLDDVVNFIPARISAFLMICAAVIGGYDYSAKNALRIFKRDRFNHKSPNSAQTESVCAGALSIRLAGDAYYFGELVKKPYIGDDTRPIERADIKRANKLMYITTYICFCVMMVPFIVDRIMMLIMRIFIIGY
jgi:adenosylcobinamide-phosphate synthase